MVSFTDHYNAISIDRLPSKIKIGKDSWYFNNSLLCKPEFYPTYKDSFFIKNTKNKYSSASDCWEYTKYRFKENAKILAKNYTTQQNITISRLLFLLKTQKTSSSASAWSGNTKSSFKCNARGSSKSSTTQNVKKDYKTCTKKKFRTKNQTND